MSDATVDASAVRDTPKRTTLSGRRFGRISTTVEVDESRERERIAALRILESAIDDRWEAIARRTTDSRHRME